MTQLAKKSKRIIAFAVACAMLSISFAQAAGHCGGPCHGSGRYEALEAGREAMGTPIHAHGTHQHALAPFSLSDPVSEGPSVVTADWVDSCSVKIGAAACSMEAFRPFLAIQGSNPEAARGHRPLTVSSYLATFEMQPAPSVNGRFEKARSAIARAAPPPLFLKNLALLI